MTTMYELAREAYAKQGIDTEAVIETLANKAISMHCWQGDDVVGFDQGDDNAASGGIMTTGNYPGRAATPEQLMADFEKAASLIPGKKRINLHASYAIFTEENPWVDRDKLEYKHFEPWVAWAKEHGCGIDFKGVYDREKREILAFSEFHRGQDKIKAIECSLDDTETLDSLIGEKLRRTLCDDVELLDGAGYEFDIDQVRDGKLSPVFFGSALNNFGIEPFLESFLDMTMPPLPRKAGDEIVDPFADKFSAFVFKIQANMNKAHRDRIAFMRICSGKFERDKEYFHVQGGKSIRLAQPQQLMAQERAIINEAYAGDIIGVFDPGIFSIGDTICDKSMKVEFEGIPTFAPEIFAGVERIDTMKRKQFEKGIMQIAQEGAIQIFHEPYTGVEEIIVGVVGILQLEVLEYRLKNEYGVDVRRRSMPYEVVRWIDNEGINPNDLNLTSDTKWVQDFRGNNLLLFTSEWCVNWALTKNPGLELREFNRD